MPTISVIVPVYKVEKYIHRCVDSILGQTFTDFELILVDDGSPDGSPAICDEYAAKDSRVVVIHQENGGLSAARNAGIDWAFANSDSQWLTFIDSDDWVHPEYLQRLLDAAVENDVAVSICGYEQTDGANPIINPESLNPVLWNTEEFYVQHNVNATIACGKLYRKECFQSIRYPVNKLHEDEFTTYKILFCYEHVAVIPAFLYAYYQNNNSIMNSKWSPKRMDVLCAYLNQAQFFCSRKKHNLVKTVLITYMWRVTLVKKHLANLEKQYLSLLYKCKLKTQSMYALLRYHKYLPIQTYPWAYETVFPVLTKIYWKLAAVRNKFHKNKQGE